MDYNQTLAENYFSDAFRRVWSGLCGLLQTYSRGNAKRVEKQVLALFLGRSDSEIKVAARAVAMEGIKSQITHAKEVLASLEAQEHALESS